MRRTIGSRQHGFTRAAALCLAVVSAPAIAFDQDIPIWERPGVEGSRFHAVTVERTRSEYRYSTATLRFGDEENSELPATLNGTAEIGDTRVQIFSDLPDRVAQNYAEALAQADHLIAIESQILIQPGHHFEIFITSAASPTNREWQFTRTDVDPLVLSLVVRADRVSSVLVSQEISDPVHERYHLSIEMLGRGRHDPRAEHNPSAAYIYEEIAAALYGSCASLLSLGYVTQFNAPGLTIQSANNPGQEYSAPYTDDVLARLLDVIEAGEFQDGSAIPHGMHLGLNLTLWAELSGGHWYIEQGTPEAQALLDGCRYSAADPFRVGPWLRQIANDERDPPEMEDRYEAFERLQIQRATLSEETGH
ncbi:MULTISPECIES: hypothetical protein [Hyphobacterium]|uniref:Uncharacterized protein n=1 Tax=Hyphobacterium vulgare TaxID=1736751 RepID=A0ABV6ZXD9_9PROT